MVPSFAATNSTYYPTYPALIKKMIEPFWTQLLEQEFQIIDPSAGSGDILDYICSKFDMKARHLYAIEQDADLMFALQGKGYQVLGDDWLTYWGDHLFDLMVMNPPFDRGDVHLLKAWNVLKSGHIVCLLNEETILNPYSENRKLLGRIIEQNGSVEYLGACFEKSERPTSVRVAMVRLAKTEPDPRFSFDFGKTHETEYDFAEAVAGDGVALNDLTGSLLRQYELTKSAYIDYIKAKKALNFYSQGLLSQYTNVSKMADDAYSSDLSRSYNHFADALRADTWSVIISKLGMSKFMTSEVEANFNRYKRTQGAMDLTRENIMAMVNMLIMNRSSIMDGAIGQVFDLFTAFHKQNRCHVEGWVTNDSWKVNRKIILPKWISYGGYRTAKELKEDGDTFGFATSSCNTYDDIDKVMCWITGTSYEACRTLRYTLDRHFTAIRTIKTGDVFEDEGQSEFFHYKFFRKGTLHLTFKDERLWEEFNFQACKNRNWLPPEEIKRHRRAYTPKGEAEESAAYQTDSVAFGSLQLGSGSQTHEPFTTQQPGLISQPGESRQLSIF